MFSIGFFNLIFVTSGCFITLVTKDNKKAIFRRWMLFTVGVVLLIVLAIDMANTGILMSSPVFDFADGTLYQDIQTGEYVMIRENLFNLLNPYEKVEMSQDKLQQIVELVQTAENQVAELAKQYILPE